MDKEKFKPVSLLQILTPFDVEYSLPASAYAEMESVIDGGSEELIARLFQDLCRKYYESLPSVQQEYVRYTVNFFVADTSLKLDSWLDADDFVFGVNFDINKIPAILKKSLKI